MTQVRDHWRTALFVVVMAVSHPTTAATPHALQRTPAVPPPSQPACGHDPAAIRIRAGLNASAYASRPLKQVRPDLSGVVRPYPTGHVVFDVGLSDTGEVRSVCLVRGLRADVNKAAETAVRQWRFEPARWRSTGAAFPIVITVGVTIPPEPLDLQPCRWHADLVTQPAFSWPRDVPQPRLVKRFEPDLSKASRPLPRGIVIISIAIDEFGNVKSPCLERGLRDDVDQAALAAVRRWRYDPGQVDGQTLAVVMTVTVQIPPDVAGR